VLPAEGTGGWLESPSMAGIPSEAVARGRLQRGGWLARAVGSAFGHRHFVPQIYIIGRPIFVQPKKN
jgi:hypothetical protein